MAGNVRQDTCTYFALTPTLDLRCGSKSQNSFYSETCHVSDQIIGNEAYNNILANNLPLHTLSISGMRSKGQNIFSEGSHVAYQIKGNIAYRKIHATNLPLHTYLTTIEGSKGQNSFYSKSGDDAHQIKGMKRATTCYKQFTLHTLWIPGMGSKGQIIFF